MNTELSQNTINFIENLVISYLRDGGSFTSIDIANPAKNKGLFARNRQVAAWLRSNVIRIAHDHGWLYNQTLIRVQTKQGMELAYLYHHMNVSPDSYLDRDQNPQAVAAVRQGTSRGSSAFANVVNDILKQGPSTKTPVIQPKVQVSVNVSGSAKTHHSNFQRRDSRGRFS